MKRIKGLLFLSIVLIINACSTLSVTKGRMLKTPLDYKYSKFEEVMNTKNYRVAVNDQIMLNMFANEGYSFVNLSAGNQQGNAGLGQVSFQVRADSTIKVPILGKVKVVGYTMEELEYYFECELEKQFQSPFVTAKINNRRIYVFSGISSASIFLLQNQNTTLFEVIAGVGGVPGNSNASKIKIIRGDLKDPQIYLVDLSTVDGIKEANLTMLAGDIVYFEPFINYGSIITGDVTNLLSILTTGVLVYTLVRGN